MSELGRFIRNAAPVSFLALALSSCASSSAAQPTVDDIKRSLPPPIIQPTSPAFYINSPHPVSIGVEWGNSCEGAPPRIEVSSPDLTATLKKDFFNNKKGKVKVEGFSAPNTVYAVSLSGENCTPFQGQTVYTDTVREEVKIIYDTLPPQSQVLAVEAINGKIRMQVSVGDNLSPIETVNIQGQAVTANGDGTYTFEFTPTGLGSNSGIISITDMAGNNGTQPYTAEYNPFKDMSIQSTVLPDGTIVFQGNVTNNIDGGTIAGSGNQAYAPFLPSWLTPNGVDCAPVQSQGQTMTLSCKPPDKRGNVHMNITMKDVNGYEQTQVFEIPMDDLPLSRVVAFDMAYLIATGLSSLGAFKAVKKSVRGADARREETVRSLVGGSHFDEAKMVMNGAISEMQPIRSVTDFFLRSRPSERLDLRKYIEDGEAINEAVHAVGTKNDKVTLKILHKLYLNPPKKDLTAKRDSIVTIWLERQVEKLEKFYTEKDLASLQADPFFDYVNRSISAGETTNWAIGAVVKNEKLRELVERLRMVSLLSIENFEVALPSFLRPLGSKKPSREQLNKIVETLCDWDNWMLVGKIIEATPDELTKTHLRELGRLKWEMKELEKWKVGKNLEKESIQLIEGEIRQGLSFNQARYIGYLVENLPQFNNLFSFLGFAESEKNPTEEFIKTLPQGTETETIAIAYKQNVYEEFKKRLTIIGTELQGWARKTADRRFLERLEVNIFTIVKDFAINIKSMRDEKDSNVLAFDELYEFWITEEQNNVHPLIVKTEGKEVTADDRRRKVGYEVRFDVIDL